MLSRAAVAMMVVMELSLTVALVIRGSAGSVCHAAVESLDLSCLLRWDCYRANASYSVQTKTQGDPWQDVPWCVQVSSVSCDLSAAFSDFQLYHMIRLGVNLSPASTVWTRPLKFDYTDLAFSPPAVSVWWEGGGLWVRVQFPCAASRRCSGGCCPVSALIDPWTTVTVFNGLDGSENQSRTVWTQEEESRVQFSGLSAGRNYCAVANFSFPTFLMAASPKSAPKCIQTEAAQGAGGLLRSLYLGVGLSSLLLLPLLAAFLRWPEQAPPPNAPPLNTTPTNAPPPNATPPNAPPPNATPRKPRTGSPAPSGERTGSDPHPPQLDLDLDLDQDLDPDPDPIMDPDLDPHPDPDLDPDPDMDPDLDLDPDPHLDLDLDPDPDPDLDPDQVDPGDVHLELPDFSQSSTKRSTFYF